MMRANQLVVETLHGVKHPGRAQMDYLLYLFVLASAVFIWWPKHSLTETLQRQNAPDTLLAGLLVCGAIIAWFSARAGAEEFLLDGQLGLRDWTVGTTMTLPNILFGYLCSHLLQTAHLIALSLPIILLAFHISGGQWPALLICLAMILCQSLFYRLTAAAIYIAIGQHGAMTAISIRGLIIVTYLLGVTLIPFASHVMITVNELDGGASAQAIHASSASVHFVALYTALSICMLCVVHRQLSRLRSRLYDATTTQ